MPASSHFIERKQTTGLSEVAREVPLIHVGQKRIGLADRCAHSQPRQWLQGQPHRRCLHRVSRPAAGEVVDHEKRHTESCVDEKARGFRDTKFGSEAEQLPSSKVKIAFDANNPGIWAFHCYILYHGARGMFTVVKYEDTPTPFWKPEEAPKMLKGLRE